MLAVLVWMAGVAVAPAAARSDDEKKLPEFADVEHLVRRHFATEEVEAWEIIIQEEVRTVLRQIRTSGWTVPDGKRILHAVPGDTTFLVSQLRTPAGHRLMKRIRKFPSAYDRLDRLSAMPKGRQTVHDLIEGPGGEKLLHYLTTTKGGAELGKQLGNHPSGADFNKPTGRIYTVDQLVERLKESYAMTRQALAANAASQP